jgi:hypothetical protein
MDMQEGIHTLERKDVQRLEKTKLLLSLKVREKKKKKKKKKLLLAVDVLTPP